MMAPAAFVAMMVAVIAATLLPHQALAVPGRRIVDIASAPLAPPLRPPASSPPPARWRVSVDLGGWSKPVAEGFLGVSHEWVDVDELADEGGLQLLQDLAAYGTGPLSLRIGGGSTDLVRSVPGAAAWTALRRLASGEELGARLILGLNFAAGDFNLTRAQFEAAQRELPQGSIAALELGNEPNFYATRPKRVVAPPPPPPSSSHPPTTPASYVPSSTSEYLACCFVNDWNAFAIPLSCPKGSPSCVEGQLAGPAWGHVSMSPATLDWFLKVNHRWVGLVTVHWYRDRTESQTSASALLDEGEMRRSAASLRALVEAAGRYGKALRVAEMNSISNNGRRGVSDAVSGALWSLDASLEAAAAGATGVNFHWGSGANVYSAVIRRSKDRRPPIVRPAFYAYALLQMALGSSGSSGGAGGGGTTRVYPDVPVVPLQPPQTQAQAQGGSAAPSPGSVKVWPLLAPGTGEARAVLINKDASAPAVVTVTFAGGGGGGGGGASSLGAGRLVRLTARGGMGATGGVTLGGVAYAPEGAAMVGAQRVEAVPRAGGDVIGGGSATFEVFLPPASAALLTVPPIRPGGAAAAGRRRRL